MRLPALCGRLSPADHARIRQADSGYTEPYNLVLVPLVPSTVEGFLMDFCSEIQDDLRQIGVAPSAVTLRQIASSLFGRRGVDPGECDACCTH